MLKASTMLFMIALERNFFIKYLHKVQCATHKKKLKVQLFAGLIMGRKVSREKEYKKKEQKIANQT